MDASVNPIVEAQSVNQEAVKAQTKPITDPNTIFTGSADDLKDVAPEIYKAIVDTMMTRVMADARHHQEHFKEVLRENERNNSRR